MASDDERAHELAVRHSEREVEELRQFLKIRPRFGTRKDGQVYPKAENITEKFRDAQRPRRLGSLSQGTIETLISIKIGRHPPPSRYLDILSERGLIVRLRGKWGITPKGLETLERYT
jgi:hypothetical protein